MSEQLALTVKEAAHALRVSESTIYWMCYNKEIPHNRVRARGQKGRSRILISKSALEDWLKGAKEVRR